MFRIPCPHCGLRNASEFTHLGEHRSRPDPRTATSAEWRAYLYEKDNVAGWMAESWYHGFGCRRFLGVERHTVTNEIRPTAGVAGAVQASQPAVDAGAPDAGSAP